MNVSQKIYVFINIVKLIIFNVVVPVDGGCNDRVLAGGQREAVCEVKALEFVEPSVVTRSHCTLRQGEMHFLPGSPALRWENYA